MYEWVNVVNYCSIRVHTQTQTRFRLVEESHEIEKRIRVSGKSILK